MESAHGPRKKCVSKMSVPRNGRKFNASINAKSDFAVYSFIRKRYMHYGRDREKSSRLMESFDYAKATSDGLGTP